ncbi:unnamed protein product [Parnassius apollo]|uniref:(apollo) hypothetical protein n=1 Tax=Parnassius apollo TaxID=110799 RepID=A0A8S3XEW6_PARAO|nr:unnamed protein product [Parnassius apollo]
MEETQKGTRIGPLPGGRRGASGAGTGRGSMRAASRARGAARSPNSPSHPSSPPEGLVSAGSSRTQQAAPAAGGARRMRWTKFMNENALRAYYRAKGEETVGIAYRSRMHRFFAELEPYIPVTEQNLADRVRYIMRSKIFDDAELERLRREAIPSSNESATAGDAAPHSTDQHPHVETAMDLPVVVDSNDDGIVSHELEQMRSILEEAILETRSTPLENRPRLPRIPLSKRNRAVVRALNPMLVTYLEASRDLCETDSILFGAAVAVCRIIGAKLPMAGRATTQSSAIPAWRKRIEDRIAKARALIGRLTSFRSGNNRPRIMRTVRMAFAGTNISLSQPDITQKLTERIDDLKQKIAAWGKRIRRFSEGSRRFNQNRLFQSDQKRLYKLLERPKVCGAGQGPDQADIIAFWRGLWSEPVNHSEGPWMEVVASQGASVTPMDPITITPEDVAEAVRRAPNWKSPGLDGLHHYWLKGKPGVRRRPLDVAVDERILAAFDDDPTISIRKVATELGLSVWKVWSVLRNDCKPHPSASISAINAYQFAFSNFAVKCILLQTSVINNSIMSTDNNDWGCCGDNPDTEEYIKCQKCSKKFHVACLSSPSIIKPSEFSTWECPLCTSLRPKTGHNDNTPVRFNPNVTVRASKRQALQSPPIIGASADEVRGIMQEYWHIPRLRTISREIYQVQSIFNILKDIDESLEKSDVERIKKKTGKQQKASSIVVESEESQQIVGDDVIDKHKAAFKSLKLKTDTPKLECMSCD